jgi:hypothetical protein
LQNSALMASSIFSAKRTPLSFVKLQAYNGMRNIY